MFRTETTAFDVAFGPVDIERMAVIPFRIGIGIGLLCRAKKSSFDRFVSSQHSIFCEWADQNILSFIV
jgi:hypothetical protein